MSKANIVLIVDPVACDRLTNRADGLTSHQRVPPLPRGVLRALCRAWPTDAGRDEKWSYVTEMLQEMQLHFHFEFWSENDPIFKK